MGHERVRLRHHAFVAPVRWLRAADAALAEFAASDDDVTILSDVVRRWHEEIDRERVVARTEPDAGTWARTDAALARAGMPGIGPGRAVFRDPWESLGRGLRRLARLEELNGPEIIIRNERELVASARDALDVQRDPVEYVPQWDEIATEDGGAIVDLSQLGWEVAQLAAGAFPRSVGLGTEIERVLDPRAGERLQEFARLDDYWEIHRAQYWEGGHHASAVVADAEIWAPQSIRGARALELPASGSSPSCATWRALMPSVPVGDRGGPLFVRAERGDACEVSFVIVVTPESEPFLVGDE